MKEYIVFWDKKEKHFNTFKEANEFAKTLFDEAEGEILIGFREEHLLFSDIEFNDYLELNKYFNKE